MFLGRDGENKPRRGNGFFYLARDSSNKSQCGCDHQYHNGHARTRLRRNICLFVSFFSSRLLKGSFSFSDSASKAALQMLTECMELDYAAFVLNHP